MYYETKSVTNKIITFLCSFWKVSQLVILKRFHVLTTWVCWLLLRLQIIDVNNDDIFVVLKTVYKLQTSEKRLKVAIWATDERLMSDWWATDERLMSDWWATDERLMSDWWTTDEWLMSDWWVTEILGYGSVRTDGQRWLLSRYRDWKWK